MNVRLTSSVGATLVSTMTVVFAVLLGACLEDDVPTEDVPDVALDVAADVAPRPSDLLPEVADIVDVPELDIPPDLAPDVPPDLLFDYVPTEGGFLWPCEVDADCNSEFCIDSADGKVCSKTCSDSCNVPGWSCLQDVSAAALLFLCQPDAPTLCDPCRANDDCVTARDNTPHRCIPKGDSGAFCGAACAENDDCPEGYACSTVSDIDGAASRQCVTADGSECSCSKGAIARDASTVCWVTSQDGSCAGARARLEGGGLTLRDAPAPELEVCNGVDDNCNNLIDETFVMSCATKLAQ